MVTQSDGAQAMRQDDGKPVQAMNPLSVAFCYLMFFLSGAAALVYQVVWVRSLTLVFGSSHSAVAAVLSIFMAGLALGGYVFGRSADAAKRPLRMYGFLELGIAFFALIFMALMNVYPSMYVFLAQGREDSPFSLFLIRIVFSVATLIIPTTLMGGTLPVLTQFVSSQPRRLRGYLAFLYGFNTLGAVSGAIVAGFYLLRFYSVNSALYSAIIVNLLVGIASIALQPGTTPEPEEHPGQDALLPEAAGGCAPSARMVLLGIGISGFCALGYEVLWTRILSLVVGATVYGFTTVLAAFLTGIAIGSGVYGLFPRAFNFGKGRAGSSCFWFGFVQILIGVSALLVSLQMRALPADIVKLTNFLSKTGLDPFGLRAWAGFLLAFFSMGIPAIGMGLAFPLAGTINATNKNRVGSAVGEVLTYNTIGAILGAAVSGFVLINLVGIERSLQILVVINIGLGLFMILSLKKRRLYRFSAAGATAAMVLFFLSDQSRLRMWEVNYFGLYSSTNPTAYDSPENINSMVGGADLLYYGEGTEAIVSSVKAHAGGLQAFVTNGRTEASTNLSDQQCQLTLGHLPLLLQKDPKTILVVGLGSGMTLGAVSVHPGVEQITLVEIEPKVVGVAKTFGEFNHQVMDNPKVKMVINDARNFLMTSKQRFNVITADPIHPWFRGAGYLYTSEYFKLAAEHLTPDGVIVQWIPLYDLAPKDVKSVVRTFTGRFNHALLWVTFEDAALIGSNAPIILDEVELEKRIAHPVINADLKRIGMGSATDFLSYFVSGTEKMREFGSDGIVNTDDNLYLEFSAPLSYGLSSGSIAANIRELLRYREDIFRYLAPEPAPEAREKQKQKWAFHREAAEATDAVHTALIAGSFHSAFIKGQSPSGGVLDSMSRLVDTYPWYAPARFLKQQFVDSLVTSPDPSAAWFNLGKTAADAGRLDDAIGHYRAAIRLKPDIARYHNLLGLLYVRTGRFDEAIAEFQAAARLAPAEPAYRRNLDRILAIKKAAAKKHDP